MKALRISRELVLLVLMAVGIIFVAIYAII